MMARWALVLWVAAAFREFNPAEETDLAGVDGEVFILPRSNNASSGAASLAATVEKVAAAYPGFEFVWVDTAEHKAWVEEELDVPEEYLPLLLARTKKAPADRFWYDEFPFARGIKDWLEEVKDGKREPLRWLTSAEPLEGGAVKDVTASNWDETLSPKPTLLAIVSEWCDHCKALKPILEQVALESPSVTVATFVFTNNSYCGYQPKQGPDTETKGGLDADGEGMPGLGMKQLEKVCWPARLPLKRYKAFTWRSVPTLFSVYGDSVQKYDGPRSVSSLTAFLNARQRLEDEMSGEL